MQALDVNSLFARAERSFAAGQADAARADLVQVQRFAGDHPAVLHLLALVEKKRGAPDAARSAFERALRLSPKDPQILNNYANLLLSVGDLDAALAHFDRALSASPGGAEVRFNRALLLQRLGRPDDALFELDALLEAAPENARFLSARAAILRETGRLDEAADSYDRALRTDPRRLVALHGRARTAMERGEGSAAEYYAHALQVSPGDLMLRLGLAEALEAEGRPGALDELAEAVALHPDWIEGQSALARMRWEAGEGQRFTRDFEQALRAQPRNRALWFAYASALAAADLSAQAADAAAQGQAAAGEDAGLQLLEALHASEAGELDRADRLFATLPDDLADRSIHEVRHLVRKKQYDRALECAERARRIDEWNVSAWAMTGLLWRITGDPRAQWLHEQPGIVATVQVDLAADEIAAVADRLRSLHRTRSHPIGQSLRGGTQTRGRLFERSEPEVRLLRDAIHSAVSIYWNALPPVDAGHPLLRHRNASPRFEGSWSVRLFNGGFHVSHVHPRGVLSSACYLVVPEAEAPQEGWLEIGSPPGGLDLPLEPLLRVEPRPGRMALFPSTLFHGTRPFAAGERLTAAFDVVPA